MRPPPNPRATRAWIIYDWAISAFSTTVMAGFFPIFFKEYWNAGVAATESSFRLGVANSTASLIVAVMAPVLGAVADAGGRRKRFLLVFAGLGIVMTASLYYVGSGQWLAAVVVYVTAVIGFSGSNVFYDSLLVSVSPPGQEDRVSARGFAIGYLGGGILFAVNVAMTIKPAWFGLADASAAVRMSFVTVACWWALFMIPLVRHVRDNVPLAPTRSSLRAGFSQLADTFHHLRRFRSAFFFLFAYWFYIDGVHTIVRMAVDYGLALGFDRNHLIASLLLVQFVGFPSSLAFGRYAGVVGTRRAILTGIAVYVLISFWGVRLARVWEFYALAVAIGLVQGGVTSLSRSYFARLIPAAEAAQFFGFYNTVGRFSAVLGPVLMGVVGVLTGNPRYSMFAVTALFFVGATLLMRVRDGEAA